MFWLVQERFARSARIYFIQSLWGLYVKGSDCQLGASAANRKVYRTHFEAWFFIIVLIA